MVHAKRIFYMPCRCVCSEAEKVRSGNVRNPSRTQAHTSAHRPATTTRNTRQTGAGRSAVAVARGGETNSPRTGQLNDDASERAATATTTRTFEKDFESHHSFTGRATRADHPYTPWRHMTKMMHERGRPLLGLWVSGREGPETRNGER